MIMFNTDAKIIKQIPYHDKTLINCMLCMNQWMGSKAKFVGASYLKYLTIFTTKQILQMERNVEQM